ncbi:MULTISPECIES: hypothetical protein [unclassified Synechococcus]|nr:hypothetical protein [Synechococcus sp. MIT S9509]
MPKRLSCITALLAGIAATSSCGEANNNNFTANGMPINPLCLALTYDSSFTPYLDEPDDLNINRVLDLNACNVSTTKGSMTVNPKEAGCPRTLEKGGKDFASYSFPWGANDNYDMNQRKGCLSYEYIGKSKSGIDVLHVRSFGGGTGQFSNIILVKRIPMKRYNFDEKLGHQWDEENFIGLLNVGEIWGGDRASGSFLEINLTGNRLNGTRYSPDNNATGGTKRVNFSFQLP